MNVEVTEDSDGYIILKGLPPESYRRLYRKHSSSMMTSADGKPKMRLKRCKSIEVEKKCKSIEIENGRPSG